ncbi:hypothetical protein ACOSP7_018408 [Xanthoceras sorbifolium]
MFFGLDLFDSVRLEGEPYLPIQNQQTEDAVGLPIVDLELPLVTVEGQNEMLVSLHGTVHRSEFLHGHHARMDVDSVKHSKIFYFTEGSIACKFISSSGPVEQSGTFGLVAVRKKSK